MTDRETLECDVVIIGAGPAGLSTAIRLAQLARETATELSIIVIEKGAEVGAHSLSGLVMDPVGLNALLPNWKNDTRFPLKTTVTDDSYSFLTSRNSWKIPPFLLPKALDNTGFLLGSLGETCRWLAAQAENLGVEIYSGFAATEILYDAQSCVTGIVTGDMGIGKDNQPKPGFAQGMNLKARYTVLAEGAKGSLSESIQQRFNLCSSSNPQSYGLGIKELWRVSPEHHKPGYVVHMTGWPLGLSQSGGGFLYHYGDNLVAVGLVTHLNYTNPTLSPFSEFQRLKTHPFLRPLFENGERLEYGARVIAEGGWQSVPKLVFPGGCLVGDAAGFVNTPRIKGTHNALLSGKLCAEHVFNALKTGEENTTLAPYDTIWRTSAIGKDLFPSRNFKPLWATFRHVGFFLAGIDLWLQQYLPFSFFGTLNFRKKDFEQLQTLSDVSPIIYDPPDNSLTFDRLSSLPFSGVFHEEDQPCHLLLADPRIPVEKNLVQYGEPARLYCPAQVYEIVYDNDLTKEKPRFIINASNCLHCKACVIKDPSQNIMWIPPEGGGGPNYQRM